MTGTLHILADLNPNTVSPGLMGFITVTIIGLVTWVLSKSMAKQLRKLDSDRVEDEAAEPSAGK